MRIPKIIQNISKELNNIGAKAIIVGGSVRDYILGRDSKDYDIEVYGLETLEELEKILQKYGKVNLVGKSFGVLKFVYEGFEYDFSFPRIEKKVSSGHRGFDISIDGALNYKEAAKRRDFTINSLGYDIQKNKILDPYGGIDDINNLILRHINNKSFIEDPLRVYRGVQFCARFNLSMDKETKKLCKDMVNRGNLDELPKERVYEEFKKLLLKSKKPSIGFELMRQLGIIKRYFKPLYKIIGVPQSPKWHPEGDVWTHTMMSLDAMASILENIDNLTQKDKLKLMFAILCHDLGKATTTKIIDGEIRALNHDIAGVEPTQKFLEILTNEQDFIDSIKPLVRYHLMPSMLYKSNAKDGAIRRLSTKVNIKELILVAKADFLGRTTKEAKLGVYEAGEWLLNRSKDLNILDKPPKPLIMGKDLITLGLKPSPKFKEILNKIYQMQLDGEIKNKNQALEYINKKLLNN